MLKIFLGAIIGGVLGFLVGYIFKCQNGQCPITSNPYISTIIGIIIGLLITLEK